MGALVGGRGRGVAEGAGLFLVLWIVVAVGIAALDDETTGDPVVDGLRAAILYAIAAVAVARAVIASRVRRRRR